MDFLAENAAAITAALTSICGLLIGITSFLKTLKSEKRTKSELTITNQNMQVTREGIVQAFKDAVITKDLKVSINSQVKKLMDENFEKLLSEITKRESSRTQLTYWCLKILGYTAAMNKLTVEQQSELSEVLAMIAEEEKICDTLS